MKVNLQPPSLMTTTMEQNLNLALHVVTKSNPNNRFIFCLFIIFSFRVMIFINLEPGLIDRIVLFYGYGYRLSFLPKP